MRLQYSKFNYYFRLPTKLIFVALIVSITIQEIAAQSSCYDDLTVPLGDSCITEISVELISSIQNSAPGWYSAGDYRVVIASTLPNSSTAPEGEICSGDDNYMGGTMAPVIDTVYGEGTWIYGIYTWDEEKSCHQLYCWGTFTTVDEINPKFYGDSVASEDIFITKPNETVFNQYGTYKEVAYLNWRTNLKDYEAIHSFTPGIWSCYQASAHPNLSFSFPYDSLRWFDTLSIKPNQDGVITVYAGSLMNIEKYVTLGENKPGIDITIMAFDKYGFDSDNPCNNLVGCADSTLILNPLSELTVENFSNTTIEDLQNNSIGIFAPWMLNKKAIAKLSFKVTANEKYTLLITHKGNINEYKSQNVDWEVNSFLIFESSESSNLPNSSNPWNSYQITQHITLYDTSFAFFDFNFMCTDVDDIVLGDEQTLNQDIYLGGSYGELVQWIDAMSGSSLDAGNHNNISQDDMQALGSAWRKYAAQILGYGLVNSDAELIQFNHQNLFRSNHEATRAFMDSLIAYNGYMPMVIENCDDWTVKITDAIETYGDCGYYIPTENNLNLYNNIGSIITRTFVVSDGGTKTGLDTAKIQLIFRNPSLYDVRLPHYTVNISCDELGDEVQMLSNGNPAPASTGYPFVATLNSFVDLTHGSTVCNLAAAYQDVARVETCSETFKFRREWTVYDWCRPGTAIIYNQLIKVGDWEAPVLATAGTIKATQNPAGCDGTITVTAPVYIDNCVQDVTYTAKVYFGAPSINNEVEDGYFDDGAGEVDVTELGTYYVVWTATDACGNKGVNDTAHTVLQDNIPPNCVIDDLRSITLTDYGIEGSPTQITNVASRGQAWVTAYRLDEGSWDNCGTIDSIHVRRMTSTGMSPWASVISFNCADEGVQVLVELKVEDSNNNQTICWMYIKPVDKTRPTCDDIAETILPCIDIPLSDIDNTINWDDYFVNHSDLTIYQLCQAEIQTLSTEENFDQCGIGSVVRNWEVSKIIDDVRFADTCSQIINFNTGHNYSIFFPADGTGNCNELDGGGISVTDGGCDLITNSFADMRLATDEVECYSFSRTYKVINWCEYKGDSFRVLDDTNCDGNELILTVYYGSSVSVEDSAIYINCRSGNDTLLYNSTGAWQWTQKINFKDEIEPTVIFNESQGSFPCNKISNGCIGEVEISATITDGCTNFKTYINLDEVHLDLNYDESGQASSFGQEVSNLISISEGVVKFKSILPAGLHRLRFVMSDDCGKVSEIDHIFTVYDSSGPSICFQNIDFINNVPPIEWQIVDCDNDGESNYLEIINGSNPYDACSKFGDIPTSPQWINPVGHINLTCEEALNFNSFSLGYTTSQEEPCNQYGEIFATKSSNYGICGEDWILSWTYTDLFGQTIQHEQIISVDEQGCTSLENNLDIPEIALQSQTIASKRNIRSRGKINSGSKVSFFAGESITLGPGFIVSQGGEFSARIQDCTNVNSEPNHLFIDHNQQESAINEYQKLKVFPNPFTSHINIERQENAFIEIGIYDMQGRLIKKIEGDSLQKLRIDLNNLDVGVYILKIISNQGVESKKIIKTI